MDWSKLTDNERLIAEHAVTTYQAVAQAAQTAPHGQGMAMIEQALHERGFETLRKIVEVAASEHAEAQKKGPAAGPAPVKRR